jgi:dUTPase
MPSVAAHGARPAEKDGGYPNVPYVHDTPFDMRRGERIVQVAPAAMLHVTLDGRDLLGNTVRGSGGLGSTSR